MAAPWMRYCTMILPSSSVGGGQRSGKTSWPSMVWAEGGWRVTMAWKRVLVTCACHCGHFRRDPWSGNESASASAGVSGGESDDDGDAHESYRESANVCVHFSMMSQVESCHASNDLVGLCPTASSLVFVSRSGVSPRDRPHLTDSIYLWGRSPCPIQIGCRYRC